MKVTKEMSNGQIYTQAEMLVSAFGEGQADEKFPSRVLFFLRKNMKDFLELAQEIEKLRMDIIEKYGTPDKEDETKYVFENKDIELVNKELQDLIDIKQEVSYYTFKLDDIASLELTTSQMDAIMDFIEYDEGE